MLALPIFTASRPATIVGADELNFCVRDGNRWTLIAINTNYISFPWQLALLGELLYYTALSRFVKRYFLPSSFLEDKGFAAPKELVTRTGFEPMLMA